MSFKSKLPNTGTSIFGVMSQMSQEYGAINLAQGFPNFDLDPELVELVTKFMQMGKNQYAPMPGVVELREAVREKQYFLQGVNYNRDTEITITAGATQALAAAIAALVEPGDEIIVFEPTYDAYVPLIQVQGGKAVPIELKAPLFLPDWEEVSCAITSKTKGIIINTPHNPCGSILSYDDLEQLAKIVNKHDLYVISDEVYEHIVFDGRKHISVGSLTDLWGRTFVISSFGKSFHATGWKCGYCLAPAALTKEFRKVHQFMVYAVNTPVQYAYAEYLKNQDNYLKVSSFYQDKRDFLIRALEGTSWRCSPTSGTYFQLIENDLFGDKSDLELATKLIKECGVALIPLQPFYEKFNAPPMLRICFAKTDDVLISGIERLKCYN